MLSDLRIVIVGLGLMGGSMARALRPHVRSVVAIDRDEQTRAGAREQGIADATYADLADVTLDRNDLVILAVPVRLIVSVIESLPASAPDGCMLIDLGSTKWDICRAMNALPGWFQAIGGHPMCGREVSGYFESDASLYHQQTFILTPTVRTTPYLRDVALAIIDAVGANPIVLPPRDHDKTVALISHLPYLLASTLMQQTSHVAGDEDTVWRVSASGFRDTSRLSGSSPTMMRDIVMTNRSAVVAQLLRFQRELSGVIEMINDANEDELFEWMQEKRRQHLHYASEKRRTSQQ